VWVDQPIDGTGDRVLGRQLSTLTHRNQVGYIPFEAEAANLFFQLVSSRYERASLIVTSNKPFGRWGEVFGDDVGRMQAYRITLSQRLFARAASSRAIDSAPRTTEIGVWMRGVAFGMPGAPARRSRPEDHALLPT
jgi:hypothetical protein